MEALFGTEEYIACRSGVTRDVPDVRITRRPDGALYGLQGEQYTRVSGIIFVSGLHPGRCIKKTPELILNPEASHPFSLEHWPFHTGGKTQSVIEFFGPTAPPRRLFSIPRRSSIRSEGYLRPADAEWRDLIEDLIIATSIAILIPE